VKKATAATTLSVAHNVADAETCDPPRGSFSDVGKCGGDNSICRSLCMWIIVSMALVDAQNNTARTEDPRIVEIVGSSEQLVHSLK
jgi:hypothetical protein